MTLAVESLYKLHSMVNMNNEQWGEFFGLQETWSKTKACTAPGQRLKGADEISREEPFQAVPIRYMQLQHIRLPCAVRTKTAFTSSSPANGVLMGRLKCGNAMDIKSGPPLVLPPNVFCAREGAEGFEQKVDAV